METNLYLPVKRFLEANGYEVKGEICGCDVVGVRQGEPIRVVVGELKLTFTLDLVLQAVDRLAASDEVWVAIGSSRRGRGREADTRVKRLCRLLGIGLLVVFPRSVEVVVEPTAWRPRRDTKRRNKLVAEHHKRHGDPTAGGITRRPIMTAYRQRALTCATSLSTGPMRPRDLKPIATDAYQILRRNVYGWFERVEHGLYGISPAGRKALETWADFLVEASPPHDLAPKQAAAAK
jgi:hypothetical protein